MKFLFIFVSVACFAGPFDSSPSRLQKRKQMSESFLSGQQQRILSFRDRNLFVRNNLEFSTDAKVVDHIIERLSQMLTMDSVRINEVSRTLREVLIYQPKYDPRFYSGSAKANTELQKHILNLGQLFGHALAFSKNQLEAGDEYKSQLFTESALRALIEAYLSIANVTGKHRLHIALSQRNFDLLATGGVLAGFYGALHHNDVVTLSAVLVTLFSVLQSNLEGYKVESSDPIQHACLPKDPNFIWPALKRKYLERETHTLMNSFWSKAIEGFAQKGHLFDIELKSKPECYSYKEWIRHAEQWALTTLDSLSRNKTENLFHSICSKMLQSVKPKIEVNEGRPG